MGGSSSSTRTGPTSWWRHLRGNPLARHEPRRRARSIARPSCPQRHRRRRQGRPVARTSSSPPRAAGGIRATRATASSADRGSRPAANTERRCGGSRSSSAATCASSRARTAGATPQLARSCGESTAAPSRRAARAARACPRAAERRRAARSRGTTAGRLGRTRDALRGRRRHLQALERTAQRKGTEARATEGFTCAQRYEEHASAFAQRYNWRVRHSPRAKQRAPSDAKDLGRHERSRRGNGRPSDPARRARSTRFWSKLPVTMAVGTVTFILAPRGVARRRGDSRPRPSEGPRGFSPCAWPCRGLLPGHVPTLKCPIGEVVQFSRSEHIGRPGR